MSNEPFALDYIANIYRCYPGEKVKFKARVKTTHPLTGLTLRLNLPGGLTILDSGSTLPGSQALPGMTYKAGTYELTWESSGEIPGGVTLEFYSQIQVGPLREQITLESCTHLEAQVEGAAPFSAEAWANVLVRPKSEYLSFLPAIYDEDELMGRFLLIFESMWRPTNVQIDELPLYIDPQLTPPDFLPWLASWLNLVLDERWPEKRRRTLLRRAAKLFRQRGTRQGLQNYLALFIGQPQSVRIVEHRAQNLKLGHTRFGQGVALGKDNKPHTFTVFVSLPKKGLTTDNQADPERMLRAIIEAEKPAHTKYTLYLKPEKTRGD